MFTRESQANQAARISGHEINIFSAHTLGGNNQIAFVLAIFIIHQDDHLALTNIVDDFFCGIQFHNYSGLLLLSVLTCSAHAESACSRHHSARSDNHLFTFNAAQQVRQEICFTDLNAVGTKQVVGSRQMKIKVGQQEIIDIFISWQFSIIFRA